MKRLLILLLSLLAVACADLAAFSRSPLPPGSTEAQVQERLGIPAMTWRLPDGGRQLAYPTGPMGTRTWMVWLDREGHLIRIDNVLASNGFAQIQSGMAMDQVLQTLGPPYAPWTVYFKARDELVWEWRYCDDWGELARFNVLFDNTSGKVRSTFSQTERMRFNTPRFWCSP